MTAGVHDATAAQAATDPEGIDLACVDLDATITTNGEIVPDETPVEISPQQEPEPVAQASTGRQVAAILSRPLRHVVGQMDSSLQTLGRFFGLGAQAFGFLITDLIRLRHPWRDTINQAWFIISVTAIPALLVSIPFGVIVAVQVGNFIQQVGASSVSGAAGGLGVIRQGAPMVAALLLGGAAGSAVATDLGARTIREEVDALRVMGVDPVQRLVTPRLAAIVFVAPVLCAFIIFMGLAAGYAINVGFQSGTPGSYIASFASFANVNDVVVAMIKTWLFGVVVILVACQRGLEAKGGARGVADAVNASVVIGVVAVFVLNLIITQGVSMSMPLRMG
ncbi:phospholipid/cholesterol/gamma-HCH transport system permease protein [Mycolicibacterium sp. BK556]|uniref:MlaE family ABC transporter permease n=2 Tax=Mycobacteriaceae TaxID=1762 RepID=UPI00160CEC50|nr:phospholipid/cholesterol/gamma-HCH transport system permease protein [Mycolicibacterium sp. BK556]MBB3632435.1 phospholipid/cholesterol/gamma-HCH transport system permease protein [Mycolicibacterium sp. BK607]MBB3750468.1 phospholipid/cholesterol/gamma-HCH transport system permease protein [Mycolicibacterium sp. BK634]